MSKGKLSNFIKSFDIFGHPVTLNFNKQGDTHNTIIGGVVSIFIKVLLLMFFVERSKTMLTQGDTKITSTEKLADMSLVNDVNLQDRNILPFIQFGDSTYGFNLVPVPKDYKKFIDFEIITSKYNKYNTSDFSFIVQNVKLCTE